MIDIGIAIIFAGILTGLSFMATLDRSVDDEYALISTKATKVVYAATLILISLVVNFLLGLKSTTETFDLVKTDSKRYVYFDGSFVNLSNRFKRNFDGDTVNIIYCKKNQYGIFNIITNYNDILVGVE